MKTRRIVLFCSLSCSTQVLYLSNRVLDNWSDVKCGKKNLEFDVLVRLTLEVRRWVIWLQKIIIYKRDKESSISGNTQYNRKQAKSKRKQRSEGTGRVTVVEESNKSNPNKISVTLTLTSGVKKKRKELWIRSVTRKRES